MTTIQRTVDIPVDHRLRLDLPIPEGIPAGRAEIQMIITPSPEAAATRKAFAGLAGSLRDSATFSRDAVELQREMRKSGRNPGATIQERFQGFTGDYEAELVDWGGPTGKEIW